MSYVIHYHHYRGKALKQHPSLADPTPPPQSNSKTDPALFLLTVDCHVHKTYRWKFSSVHVLIELAEKGKRVSSCKGMLQPFPTSCCSGSLIALGVSRCMVQPSAEMTPGKVLLQCCLRTRHPGRSWFFTGTMLWEDGWSHREHLCVSFGPSGCLRFMWIFMWLGTSVFLAVPFHGFYHQRAYFTLLSPTVD